MRRGLRNGAGWCKHCGKFGMCVETGLEPLECCTICNASTFWTYGTDIFTGERYWYCEKHAEQRPRNTRPHPLDETMEAMKNARFLKKHKEKATKAIDEIIFACYSENRRSEK